MWCSALSCAANKCYTVLQASSYPKPGDKTTMYERKRRKNKLENRTLLQKKNKKIQQKKTTTIKKNQEKKPTNIHTYII